ncbi:MAG: hypothetical protein WKF58_09045 [Ilumatobacteraceae bacterium]
MTDTGRVEVDLASDDARSVAAVAERDETDAHQSVDQVRLNVESGWRERSGSTSSGTEVLVLDDVPDPDPAAGQVRVAVEASGVHFIDTTIRAGAQMGPYPLPGSADDAGPRDRRRGRRPRRRR